MRTFDVLIVNIDTMFFNAETPEYAGEPVLIIPTKNKQEDELSDTVVSASAISGPVIAKRYLAFCLQIKILLNFLKNLSAKKFFTFKLELLASDKFENW